MAAAPDAGVDGVPVRRGHLIASVGLAVALRDARVARQRLAHAEGLIGAAVELLDAARLDAEDAAERVRAAVVALELVAGQ